MSLGRNAVTFGAGELGSRVPLLVLEFVLARLLGPALYGLWSILQSVVLYGNFLHFGAVPALARREPGLKVHERFDEIAALRRATYGFQCAVVALALVVGVLLALSFPGRGEGFGPLVLLIPALLLTVFLQQIQMTAQASAINSGHFVQNAQSRILYAVVFLILGLGAAYLPEPLVWLMLAWSTALALGAVMLFWRLPGIRAVPGVDVARSTDLVRDGFPIFLQSLMRLALSTMDKFVVWFFAAPTLLGVYALGALAANLNMMLISIICRVATPRLLTLRAEIGDDLKVVPEIDRTYSAGLWLTFLGALGAGAFGPLVIAALLPEYVAGFWTTTLLACAGAFVGFAAMVADIALSFGIKRPIVMTTLATIGVLAVALAGVWWAVGTIEASAAVMLVVFIGYSAVLLHVSYRAMGVDVVTIRGYTVRHLAAGVACTVLALVLTAAQIALMEKFGIDSSFYWALNGMVVLLLAVVALIAVRRFRLGRSGQDGLKNERVAEP